MYPLIRAEGLTKIVQSGDEPLSILENVSFDVEPGAAVAIVGASGSGKTTLLGLLAGLDRPTAGEVVIDQANYSVSVAGKAIELTFKEYELLRFLASHRGRVARMRARRAAEISGVSAGQTQT